MQPGSRSLSVAETGQVPSGLFLGHSAASPPSPLFALPPLFWNLLVALSLSWPPKAVPRACRGAGLAWSRPCEMSTFPNLLL